MADNLPEVHYPDDLTIPFYFIPHGAPEPTEWLARHPNNFRIPATFIPRPAKRADPPKPVARSANPPVPAALLGGTAAASWGWGEATRELILMSTEDLLAAVAGPFAAVGLLLYPSSMGPRKWDERPAPGGLVPPPPPPAPAGHDAGEEADDQRSQEPCVGLKGSPDEDTESMDIGRRH